MRRITYSMITLFLIGLAFNVGAWSKTVQEEFHQTYSISPSCRVELDNINGDVKIQVWDRSEVQVNAIKYGETERDLAQTNIRVDADSDSIAIRTEYPHSIVWSGNNSVNVEYTITVPKNARLDAISLVNGNLEITGVSGTVSAATVNGGLRALDLSGEMKLSTVNGSLNVAFTLLNIPRVSLSSVNGSLELKLPSNVDAKINASTVNGSISNEFGLTVDKGRWVGEDLSGVIGGGRTRIDLGNVNGKISILKN